MKIETSEVPNSGPEALRTSATEAVTVRYRDRDIVTTYDRTEGIIIFPGFYFSDERMKVDIFPSKIESEKICTIKIIYK